MNQQSQNQTDSYVQTLKRIVYIPAIITTLIGMLMVIDYYLPLQMKEETLIATGKRDVYKTEEGHKFLSGYYTYYAFNDNEVCRIYHTPIFHVVPRVGDEFEPGVWHHYQVWNFYVGHAIYAHILFLFSLFIVVKKRFNNGIYYAAYLLLLFIGFMLWLMLWA